MSPGFLRILSGCLVLISAVAGHGREAEAEGLHDSLKSVEAATDQTGLQVFTTFATYDADGLLKSLAEIESRLETEDAQPLDRYLLAQGYVHLLIIHKFYDRSLPAEMPGVLKELKRDALSEKGQQFARDFAAAHPDHSDIHRVLGELISFQIQGMVAGMTKGPLAREAVDRALELDPKNGWAVFSAARMHFHNPPFAGGDKDLALKEFRQVAESLDRFRVQLYLARAYESREMLSQARFWAKKSLRTAPDNPEAKFFFEQLNARIKEGS